MGPYQNIQKEAYVSGHNNAHLHENMHLMFYSTICFFVPFLMGQPQFLIGTIVNSALILGAFYLNDRKLIALIILPSLAVFSRNILFGPSTAFLAYMIPFIWLGNALFVYGNRFFRKLKIKMFFSLVLSASLKTALLFLSALILFKLNIIPPIFLASMGLVQFYTAMTGGMVAYGIIKTKELLNSQ